MHEHFGSSSFLTTDAVIFDFHFGTKWRSVLSMSTAHSSEAATSSNTRHDTRSGRKSLETLDESGHEASLYSHGTFLAAVYRPLSLAPGAVQVKEGTLNWRTSSVAGEFYHEEIHKLDAVGRNVNFGTNLSRWECSARQIQSPRRPLGTHPKSMCAMTTAARSLWWKI